MGSSGGSSGEVSYPEYLQTIHADWLNKYDINQVWVDKSMADCINDILDHSPWLAKSAYDPDTDIASFEAELSAMSTILAGMVETTDWGDAYDYAGVKLANNIADAVDAYSDIIDDNIETKSLPRFRRGMQDINAVQSSSYVIGAALIEGFRNRDVANFTADLIVKAEDRKVSVAAQITSLMTGRISSQLDLTKSFVDAMRIKIVAKKEQVDQDGLLDEKDALWNINAFQQGANLIASISGGTVVSGTSSSAISSTLGGAMSGASIGTSIYPGIGTAVGAVIGGVAGYLSS